MITRTDLGYRTPATVARRSEFVESDLVQYAVRAHPEVRGGPMVCRT